MKLYHGTDAFYLDEVVSKGLIPRGDSPGNYAEIPSHPGAVYLTNAYALHYCRACSKESDAKIVVEVDVDLFDKSMLAPDEDFLAQASKSPKAPINDDLDLVARTEIFRERAFSEFSDLWPQSLEFLGTCAYYSRIHQEAITRIAVIHVNAPIWMASDPTVTIQNYRFMGPYYRNLTKWIFGDLDFEEDPIGHFDHESINRGNISVIDVKDNSDV